MSKTFSTSLPSPSLETVVPHSAAHIASVSDYISLLKPRVMSLVVFTALCGMLTAPGQVHPFLLFVSLIAIAGGAGGAGCLNMWLETSTDAVMERTKYRPLPLGKISPHTARDFGYVLCAMSVGLLALASNYVAAFLLAFTIFFYVVIYTILLKKRTPQNIVIGGLSGALPPLIGWVAHAQTYHLAPLIMVLIIFLWTVPHFWALALVKYEDYAKAGIPMMPSVKGAAHTKKLIVVYTIFTALSPLLLVYKGFNSVWFGAFSVLLGSIFLYYSVRLQRKKIGGEMKLFAYSITYLFLIFLGLTCDHLYIPSFHGVS